MFSAAAMYILFVHNELAKKKDIKVNFIFIAVDIVYVITARKIMYMSVCWAATAGNTKFKHTL